VDTSFYQKGKGTGIFKRSEKEKEVADQKRKTKKLAKLKQKTEKS
jgi:hypothetical protein